MADKHGKNLNARRHHDKSKLCYTRPSYREARWERAVKVYTINLESRYLVVSGVASIGVDQELMDKFSSFGNILEYRKLDDYPTEDFTEVYLIKYEKINNARFAKRKMDNKSFFGGILHVFYAPEHETVEECRFKLEDRRRTIARKTQGSFKEQQQQQQDTVPPTRNTPEETNIYTKPLPETTTSISSTTTNATPAHTVSTDTSSPNTGYNQNNYLWNLPPLPPPPVETNPATRGIATGQFAPRTFHPFMRENPATRVTSAGQFSPGNFVQENPSPRGHPPPSSYHSSFRGNVTRINSYPATRGIVTRPFLPRDFHHIPRGDLAPRRMGTEQFWSGNSHPTRENPAPRGTFTGRSPLQSSLQRFSNGVVGQQAVRPPVRLDTPLLTTSLKRQSETETTSISGPQGPNTLNKKQRKRI